MKEGRIDPLRPQGAPPHNGEEWKSEKVKKVKSACSHEIIDFMNDFRMVEYFYGTHAKDAKNAKLASQREICVFAKEK